MFRFERLEIWQVACDIGSDLCDLADFIEELKRYRFAEQLRAAALSISNNIAEGSGSHSPHEFKSFLNYARRSAFECASMVAFFTRRGLLTADQRQVQMAALDSLCRKITSFSKTL